MRQMTACGGLNQTDAGVCEWMYSWSDMKLHGDKHGQLSQCFVSLLWEIGEIFTQMVVTVKNDGNRKRYVNREEKQRS